MTVSSKERCGHLSKIAMVLFICAATCLQMQADDSVGGTPISIDETNFPDAAFREYVSSQYDVINPDGKLDEHEISGAISMYVFDGSVTSLKGIEYFTALQEVSIFGTQIESLDLANCEVLTTLACYDNTKLAALNVSGCKALTKLNCNGCRLTSLDVTQNKELKWLFCSGNKLTGLDVSQNKELEWLSCSENQLTALDFSENAKLANIDCFTNHIGEAQMGMLVESLPVVIQGNLQITNIVDSKEKNVISSNQAAAANAKGWIVMDRSGKYYGVDPTESGSDFTAKSVEGVDMWFTVTSEEEKTCQVKKYRAISELTEGHVTIPGKANGYTVTGIGPSAFDGCNKMTSISIPETITSIGEGAFCNTGLTSVTLPNSVREVGIAAFSQCSALTSVVLSESMYEISIELFRSCSSLTSVTIPESVVTIKGGAFMDCSSLTSVSIPDRVGAIGGMAFSGCSSLTSVSLPSRLNFLGNSAFYECSSLTSITIPDEVYRLDSYTFGGCSSLASVTMGSSVGVVEDNAFSDCNALTDFFCRAEAVPMTGEKAFESSDIGRATLHVSSSAVEAYKASKPWSDFGAIVAGVSGIRDARASTAANGTPHYSLSGIRVDRPGKGIYVIDRKKVVKR